MNTNSIESLLSELAHYARLKNVDGIMSLYHPSATSFEFGQTGASIGFEQIRANCINGYKELTGVLHYEFDVEKIVEQDDLGFCYGLERITGAQAGETFSSEVRATYAFQKHAGRWFIIHQHLSASGA